MNRGLGLVIMDLQRGGLRKTSDQRVPRCPSLYLAHPPSDPSRRWKIPSLTIVAFTWLNMLLACFPKSQAKKINRFLTEDCLSLPGDVYM
jgi:hypothetical protein